MNALRACTFVMLLAAAATLGGCTCGAPALFVLTPHGTNDYTIDNEDPAFTGTLHKPTASELFWTLEGTFTFPHPGFVVVHQVEIAETFPEQVTIRFSIIPPPEGNYPQVMTEKPVSASVLASVDAHVSVVAETWCIPGLEQPA